MLTAYTLSHGHFTVIPHHLDENFADMVDCGFDAVALSFSESEMVYSRRAFEIQVNLARKRGLKVLVVPSRLGGRFAGAPLMPSIWLYEHPECVAPADPWLPVAALEAPAFVDWIKGFMTTLLTDYELDGIIWDEMKEVAMVHRHPATVARFGPDPTRENMMDSAIEFIGDLNRHCLAVKPGLSITFFAMRDREYFTQRAAAAPGVEYFGYDGNLARQSFFHEEPKWVKHRIESMWERTVNECAAAGKKTFALVENMLMPKEAVPEFEANFEAYLQNYRPDHLAVYYYAHNNEDPEAVHGIVRRLLRRYA
ncbi:MAG TPA: hypothetical protein PK280_05855 [Planctomycetota bacterium]|nr:hypothetical protein [Planctomycetota bacterium]